MLLLHEVHTVAGRHEEEFEATFRDGWRPDVAADDGTRLLYYLKLAHGTGHAYHHVSITGLRDGAAYERLATRVQRGDLRKWAAGVDALRHEVKGKLLLPVEWSPLREIDLEAVPTEGIEHDPVLYMEDSAWPHEEKLDDYLEARAHALRAEPRTTQRTIAPHAARRVPGRARRAPPARGRAVATRRLPRATSRALHAGAPRARQGPGHVDARRARGARRLGEPAAAQRLVVTDGLKAPAVETIDDALNAQQNELSAASRRLGRGGLATTNSV